MSGTTADLAELSLQVNYSTVSQASNELESFRNRAYSAGRESDNFNSSSTRLDQSVQALNRTMGLQSQQLSVLLPQYQGYVRYAEEMQRATLQLTLEQTRYLTAMRDIEPVLRNLGLFSREFSQETVQTYERLTMLTRQLGTTTQAYREAAEASKKFTDNIAEQRNIQQQFIAAFTGQGPGGQQGRQRLEDYIGPLGDQSASEAMQRFAERLRSVRDVATQTRDAMSILGTTSLETVRNIERLGSVDIGATARAALLMQQSLADNQVTYRNEISRINAATAAAAAAPGWFGTATGAISGAYNTASLTAASFANSLEAQTWRREAEFSSYLTRNLGTTVAGIANASVAGSPSINSLAAMIPGAFDWITGREWSGPGRPVFSALSTAPLQALSGLGGMVAGTNPEVAAMLQRLRSAQGLQQIDQIAPGALDEALFLSGIGTGGTAAGPSVRNQGGVRGMVAGTQEEFRNLIRDLASAPNSNFTQLLFGSNELQAGMASRAASDFMGGAANRSITEMEQLAQAAMEGTRAVALLQSRLSDETALRQFQGASGNLISGFEGVARAAAEAARAAQFGPQFNAYLATGPASARQLEMAQMAAGLGGWMNPLSGQQAALAFERDDALATAQARYSDPVQLAQAQAQIAQTFNTRQIALSQLFNTQQGERISQQTAQAQITGAGYGLVGIDAQRFGIAQQMMALNPAYFSTNGRFDLGTFQNLAGGDTSMLPQGAAELFRMLLSNAQTDNRLRATLGGMDFAAGAFGGIIQGGAAAGGPAALRAAQANSGAIMQYIQEASAASGVPVQLLRAIGMQESRLGTDPAAGGNVMQFIQSTWSSFTGLPMEQRNDPRTNIMQAARYIRSFGLNVQDPSNWSAILRRYNGGGDPNYVSNVSRWLDPGAVAANTEAGFVAGQVGQTAFAAQSSDQILAMMRSRTNTTGTFESNLQGISQALSQGITDPAAITQMVENLNRAAAAQARLNQERDIFNSQQEMEGYLRFSEVMRQTGGNIELARAAMERFAAARRAGISEGDVGAARSAQAIAGAGRLGVDEALRGQGLTQQNYLAGLEYGTLGMPERDRQITLAVAQEDMRFSSQVDRLRANVDFNDLNQVSQFESARQAATETYNINRATIADTARLRGMLQDAQRAQEMMLEPLRGALRNMQTEAANFWRVLLEGGEVAGKDIERLLSNVLKSAASQFLGTFSTNLIAGTGLNILGLGSFGSSLGIPDMSSFGGSMGGGAVGGSLAPGLTAGSFGGGTSGSLINSLLSGGSGGATGQAGMYTPNTFSRGGYMSGMMGTLSQFMPLIATTTGIDQLGGLGAMMGVNQLMNLNSGGQGLLSWGGLTTAGNNMYAQSTWLDRLLPSLFSNGANVAAASSLGSFGSQAATFADAAGAFGGLYGLSDFSQAASGAAGNIGGTSGALGMTGAQALAGLGAVAGIANFAMNPGIGSGLSAAGGITSALAAYGAIGSAFGPIGAAVGVIGALVSTYLEAGKNKGYSGATGQIGVQSGLLQATNVGGKGVDVNAFNQQLQSLTEGVNKANAELNLTVGEGFGNQYVGVGMGVQDASRAGALFDTNDPYLSLLRGGNLKRASDDFLTSILRGEKEGFSINGTSVDTFANAIRFYDDYYKTAIDTNIAPSSLVQQQRDLRSSYSTGKSQANYYGFDQNLIDVGYRTRFNEDTRRGLMSVTDPMGSALEDFDKLASERLDTARLIGADINMVERLNGEERKKIVEQYMSGITNVFRSALKNLTQGDIAGETDLSKYNASLAAYGTLLQKYPSASTEDQGRFVEQAMSLVGNARSLFSDTPEFAAVYQRVLADLLQLAPEGSDEGNAAAAALKRLQSGYGGTVASLSQLPNNQGVPTGVATTPTSQSMADLVAASPIGKDVAAGLAPGLTALGELINTTNNILREILVEQRTTNGYIKAKLAQ